MVADLYDDHVGSLPLHAGIWTDGQPLAHKARRTQLVTHEALKNVAHPYQSYEVPLSLCHPNSALIMTIRGNH